MGTLLHVENMMTFNTETRKEVIKKPNYYAEMSVFSDELK